MDMVKNLLFLDVGEKVVCPTSVYDKKKLKCPQARTRMAWKNRQKNSSGAVPHVKKLTSWSMMPRVDA